jgi:hypothetical protein
MKPNILFVFSFITMVFVTIIVVFFLNKFLFLIYGYSMDLTKSASVKAFEAYRTIYKTKVVIIAASFFISIILLLFARKLTSQIPHFIYVGVYVICWIIAIIFSILCAFLMFFPTDPLV